MGGNVRANREDGDGEEDALIAVYKRCIEKKKQWLEERGLSQYERFPWDTLRTLVGRLNNYNIADALLGEVETMWHAFDAETVEKVTKCIAGGANVNAINEEGPTPLHYASKEGQFKVVSLLLTHGADVKVVDEDDWTALHYAAEEGHTEVVSLLLDRGADAMAVDEYGGTALHYASYGGHPEVVSLLLDRGADVKAVDGDGKTALHDASEGGHFKIVSLLLSREADVKAVAKDGCTALHFASRFGYSGVVSLLVLAGADVDSTDFDGRTPLGYMLEENDATLEKQIGIARILCDKGSKPMPLMRRSSLDNEQLGLHACTLYWYECHKGDKPQTEIPPEVIKGGEGAVKTYLEDLETTATGELVFRRKVCVVGPSTSGKTNLVQSITKNTRSLAAKDDRTIGIDLTSMSFITESAGEGVPAKRHNITFWDFAGQDIYLVAHALFFSKYSLYLLCVDLYVYTKKLEEAESRTTGECEKLKQRFFEENILRWVRQILLHQPEADFKVIGTKADLVEEHELHAVQVDVNTRLAKFTDDNDMQLSAEVQTCLKAAFDDGMEITSMKTDEAIQQARACIKQAVVNERKMSGGFPMTTTYSKVLEHIVKLRPTSAGVNAQQRIEKGVVPVNELCKILMTSIPDLDAAVCREVLAVLHELGDILWYKDSNSEFKDLIIIDLTIIFDLVREVTNHNYKDKEGDSCGALRDDGTLQHAEGVLDEIWNVLTRLCHEDPTKNPTLDQVLQEFGPRADKEGEKESKLHPLFSPVWAQHNESIGGNKDADNDTYLVLVTTELLSLLKERCTKNFVVFRSVVDHLECLCNLARTKLESAHKQVSLQTAILQLLEDMLTSQYYDLGETHQILHWILEGPQRAQFALSIHKKIDEMTLASLRGLGDIGNSMSWKRNWEDDRHAQAEYFRSVMDTITAGSLTPDDKDDWLTASQFWSKQNTSALKVEQNLIQATASMLSDSLLSTRVRDRFDFDADIQIVRNNLSTDEIVVAKHLGEWLDAPVSTYLGPLENWMNGKRWFLLNHPHIMNLLGCCESKEGLLFICECDSRNLTEHLNYDKHQHHVWKLLYEAALGLQYIHDSGIIHTDIRCRNILVGTDGTARIGGLCWNLSISDQRPANGPDDRTRWKSPEEINSTNAATRASDVYSFGMTVLEAVTGAAPCGINMSDDEIKNIVKEGRLPQRPQKISDDQRALVQSMCAAHPVDRITIHEIVGIISEFADEEFRSNESKDRDGNLKLLPTVPDGGPLSRAYRRDWVETPTNIKKFDSDASAMEAFEELKTTAAGGGGDDGSGSEAMLNTRPIWYIPQFETWTAEFEPCGQTVLTSCFLGTWLDAVVIIEKVRSPLHAAKVLSDIADVWYSLKHPNVLHLFGACHDVRIPFFVREYAPLGTLKMYLQSYKGQHNTWQRIFEVTCAVRYLHSHGIVHNDIRCENAVVTMNGTAKLSGFHLARPLERGTTDIHNTRVRWTAPEVLNGALPSPASDVYSLAMLAIEAVTGTLPWGDRCPDIKVRDLVAVQHKIPRKPANLSERMWMLIQRMSRFEPSERVGMSEVVRQLKIVAAVESHVPEHHACYEDERDKMLTMELILDRYFEIHDKPDIVGYYCPSHSDDDGCSDDDDGLLPQRVKTIAKFASEDVLDGDFKERLDDARTKAVGSSISSSESDTATSCTLQRVSPEWFIDADEIDVEEHIDRGGYGSVYYGTWLGSPVAIKYMNELDEEAFQRELGIWYGLNHPHIVNLFGANDSTSEPFFVCDLANTSRGHLGKAIATTSKKDIWKMLYQTASALQYLHSREIVHADLKGDNILIKDDDKAQLTDFGLSLRKTIWTRVDAVPVTAAVRWTAPECLDGQTPSIASDVFSLGMCSVQAVTGKLPWEKLADKEAVRYHAKRCELPTQPSCFSCAEWRLVKLMCCTDPKDRLDLDTASKVMRIFAFDKLSTIENRLFAAKTAASTKTAVDSATRVQHPTVTRWDRTEYMPAA